jgi:hypothetical protein
MELVQWVIANSKDLLLILTSIITLASIIVKLTPTLKDDAILLPIVKFLGKYIALNKSVTEEDRPK